MLKRKLPLILAAALMGCAATIPQAQAGPFDNGWHEGWNDDRPGWNDYRGGWGWGANIDRQQERLLNQMNRGLANGRLSQPEFNMLMSRYNEIASLEARLRVGGLNPGERWRLNNQLSHLQNSLRMDMNDRETAGRYRRWY